MDGHSATNINNPLEESSDKEIITACLANSDAAWEVLIGRYERLIYSITIRFKMSPQESLEVFQSVCFILLKKLSTLRNHEKIYSWLITTTTRECWRIATLRQRELAPLQSNELNGSGASSDKLTAEQLAYERRMADEQNQIVLEAISTLPERCRELIRMLFYLNEEPTYGDIAERLNIPVSSIGPTRMRCLEKLKNILQEKLSGR